MATTDEYIGGFLMAEGTLSVVASQCKGPISQVGRLIRIGLGYYIYRKAKQ